MRRLHISEYEKTYFYTQDGIHALLTCNQFLIGIIASYGGTSILVWDNDLNLLYTHGGGESQPFWGHAIQHGNTVFYPTTNVSSAPKLMEYDPLNDELAIRCEGLESRTASTITYRDGYFYVPTYTGGSKIDKISEVDFSRTSFNAPDDSYTSALIGTNIFCFPCVMNDPYSGYYIDENDTPVPFSHTELNGEIVTDDIGVYNNRYVFLVSINTNKVYKYDTLTDTVEVITTEKGSSFYGVVCVEDCLFLANKGGGDLNRIDVIYLPSGEQCYLDVPPTAMVPNEVTANDQYLFFSTWGYEIARKEVYRVSLLDIADEIGSQALFKRFYASQHSPVVNLLSTAFKKDEQ